ncbi:hypothetical protein V1520DRAFT_379187 [Lipomyces starkeyi]|uniref:Ketoreductase (KR) domain-containing protein n=1 Tax=Lipomyces starkeyi NRRL Y-11557 TaxID=675824 RepID=A0A1E3PW28_LIPST|nr:hypothetical protein LIPSTDRAFT_107767 [Lipomyces starkeyi NRRL Y-11557]
MSLLSQIFPPSLAYTEKDVPELFGKARLCHYSVYLITGGYSGVGLEVCRVLYHRGGRVIIVGRSQESYETVVEDIMTNPGETADSEPGSLEFVKVDLADLANINPAIEKLLRRIERLDVVWYNAGVMFPPVGSKTKQGYELQWGTNVVAHFALHKLLTPILTSTAASSPAGTVRAIWVSSIAHTRSPKPYGINFDDINYTKTRSLFSWITYAQSKAGAVLLADEYAKRSVVDAALSEDGTKKNHVISISLNPGNLKTNLRRHSSRLSNILFHFILYPQRLGGITELYGGLAPETGVEEFNGGYVIPFGRKGEIATHVKKGLTEAGTGKKLWDLLEEEVKPYI